METIWKLVEICITPIITYGSELWEPNKEEKKMINRIMDNIIKRIIMVPTSTPRETIYTETGIRDPEYVMKQKRTSMLCRLEAKKNELISMVMDLEQDHTWKNKTTVIMEELGIPENISTKKKTQQKRMIQMALERDFHKRITESRLEKSKVEHLLQGINRTIGKRPDYMNKLNRHQTSIIFKARTRMIDVKNNFRCKYQNNICRGCGLVEETQEHVLNECHDLHIDESTKITKDTIFSEDVETLREAAKKLERIVKRLSHSGVQHDNVRSTTR